jgi:Xaa-Pro aminopeptidase
MTEFEIAGILAKNCYNRQIIPIVNLIATDKRIGEFRHPLPTVRKLKKHVMMVLGARRWGLIASATRAVHFGSLSSDFLRDSEACARIDSVFIQATNPGVKLSEVFSKGIEAYEKERHKDLWKLHHQGGITGYLSREVQGNLSAEQIISVNQAFAWNPIVNSTKSEDTLLLTEKGIEIITQVDEWPLIKCNGINRPGVLIR